MLFDCQFISWWPSWLAFSNKLSFVSHDQYDVDGWVESKRAIYFVLFLSRLRTFCKEAIAYKSLL